MKLSLNVCLAAYSFRLTSPHLWDVIINYKKMVESFNSYLLPIFKENTTKMKVQLKYAECQLPEIEKSTYHAK